MYNESFYEYIEENSKGAAGIIMSYIMDRIHPQSIVDFGCAEGVWLKAAKEVDENVTVLGLDGDYVDRERLKIPDDCFQAVDLSKPVQLHRKYDLAISLEVAEHINEDNSDTFISNLVDASNHILFSAAIPGQGGVDHVNERWQSYWVEKFAEKGYFPDTGIRDFFWNDGRIKYWYRQNMLFFSKEKIPEIAKMSTRSAVYDIAHPELVEVLRRGMDEAERQLYSVIANGEEFRKLNETCREILRTKKKIVIYPFGTWGKICRRILNCRYGVQGVVVADNKMCLTDANVYSVRDLLDLKDDFVVLVCCNNPDYQEEIESELRKFVKNEKIYSAF